MARQKLEPTGIGKDVRPKLQPRILRENPAKCFHVKRRVTENDIFDNRLIFSDTLLALRRWSRSSFRMSAATAANRYRNLTITKIPGMVLQKCEWAHDNYSLNVENLPQAAKPAQPTALQISLLDALKRANE